MLPKDRILIDRLRKRISLLMILIFSLGYWIRLNYYDLESKQYEIEDMRNQLSEYQNQIQKLKKNSTTKKEILVPKEIKKPKNIINTTKKVEIKKDTILPQKIDTLEKYLVTDTTNQ